MSKTFSIILIVLALALIAYNVTLVDFENPFQGDSTVALIGIVASLCAIILLLIFMTSKKIQDKLNKD
jgi:O-antigen ligase